MKQLSEYCSPLEVSVAGLDLTLHRANDLESLWDNMVEADFTDDERIPYWTELWPSSLVLSEWIKTNKSLVENKKCLDMGCGLGLTALVAANFNAQVMAMDYEKLALSYAKKNAIENKLDTVCWVAMDWRKPALKKESLDFIWGGDIIYERRFVGPVIAFLEHCLKAGGKAWLAEPSREDVFALFRHTLNTKHWKHKLVHEQKIPALYAQPVPVTVRLWEISKK